MRLTQLVILLPVSAMGRRVGVSAEEVTLTHPVMEQKLLNRDESKARRSITPTDARSRRHLSVSAASLSQMLTFYDSSA